MCMRTQQLGGSGDSPTGNCWEFRDYEIASETIFGPKRCFSEARRRLKSTQSGDNWLAKQGPKSVQAGDNNKKWPKCKFQHVIMLCT